MNLNFLKMICLEFLIIIFLLKINNYKNTKLKNNTKMNLKKRINYFINNI